MFENKKLTALQDEVEELSRTVNIMAAMVADIHKIAVRTETRVCRVANHFKVPYAPDPKKQSN